MITHQAIFFLKNSKYGFLFKHLKILIMGDYFWFGSVFIKKINQIKIFFKKTRNRPVSVQFCRKKPVQTGLAWFFWFGFVLARFFPVRIGFFSVSGL
jgi:hypothetical protein